jgi:hypothetical protein
MADKKNHQHFGEAVAPSKSLNFIGSSLIAQNSMTTPGGLSIKSLEGGRCTFAAGAGNLFLCILNYKALGIRYLQRNTTQNQHKISQHAPA